MQILSLNTHFTNIYWVPSRCQAGGRMLGLQWGTHRHNHCLQGLRTQTHTHEGIHRLKHMNTHIPKWGHSHSPPAECVWAKEMWAVTHRQASRTPVPLTARISHAVGGSSIKSQIKTDLGFRAFQGEGNKQASVAGPGALRKKNLQVSLKWFLAGIKLTARLQTADKVLHHALLCERVSYTCCFH